jgi:hypothetical protein
LGCGPLPKVGPPSRSRSFFVQWRITTPHEYQPQKPMKPSIVRAT